MSQNDLYNSLLSIVSQEIIMAGVFNTSTSNDPTGKCFIASYNIEIYFLYLRKLFEPK